jgi:hypothetical protein
MRSYDNPSTFNNVGSVAPCTLKHRSQVQFRKVTDKHTLEQVRAKLQLLIPPFWPTTTYHISPSIIDYDFAL